MDYAQVQQALVKVLQDIQATSGLACPVLNGATKPIDDLPDFDSKMWPVATAMLAQALGVSIADDINVFRQDQTHTTLSLSETVAKVLQVAQPIVLPALAEVTG